MMNYIHIILLKITKNFIVFTAVPSNFGKPTNPDTFIISFFTAFIALGLIATVAYFLKSNVEDKIVMQKSIELDKAKYLYSKTMENSIYTCSAKVYYLEGLFQLPEKTTCYIFADKKEIIFNSVDNALLKFSLPFTKIQSLNIINNTEEVISQTTKYYDYKKTVYIYYYNQNDVLAYLKFSMPFNLSEKNCLLNEDYPLRAYNDYALSRYNILEYLQTYIRENDATIHL